VTEDKSKSKIKVSRHLHSAFFVREAHCRSIQVWRALSRDLIALPAHPCVSQQMEGTIPVFVFPIEAGPHLLTLKGWKAELNLFAAVINLGPFWRRAILI